jgi:cytidylate kinase
MKKLIIVNGTMGAGKSTVCERLLKKLDRAVYLDGDWCWMMDPFVVNEENKAMVMRHITYLLRGFLTNSNYDHVIFCWVIHQEEIFDQILEPLSDLSFDLIKVTLMLHPAALEEHIMADVEKGKRSQGDVQRSVARQPLYEVMDTHHLWVDDMTPDQAAEAIGEWVREADASCG